MGTTFAGFQLFCNMSRGLVDRQLFLTRAVRFGCTIRGVNRGDAQCDFNVAPTRHVLSKAPLIADEAFKWKPVGRAYVVDGVMHGEANEIAREEKDVVLI